MFSAETKLLSPEWTWKLLSEFVFSWDRTTIENCQLCCLLVKFSTQLQSWLPELINTYFHILDSVDSILIICVTNVYRRLYGCSLKSETSIFFPGKQKKGQKRLGQIYFNQWL